MKNAIIDIPLKQELNNQRPVFEVLIKQDDKTIYHNKTYAIVMNLVQSVTELDLDTGELEGDSQILCVGHPIIQWFALDQLNKKLKEAGMVDRGISMIVQVIKNPKLKKQLLEVMKKAGIK